MLDRNPWLSLHHQSIFPSCMTSILWKRVQPEQWQKGHTCITCWRTVLIIPKRTRGSLKTHVMEREKRSPELDRLSNLSFCFSFWLWSASLLFGPEHMSQCDNPPYIAHVQHTRPSGVSDRYRFYLCLTYTCCSTSSERRIDSIPVS
jgi:hypothetical protein